MFDERTALKIRLEQMNDAEERLLQQMQKERALIFNRLRELDAKEQQIEEFESDIEGQDEQDKGIKSFTNKQNEDSPIKTRRGRPSRRSKTTKMKDTAIEILKQNEAPMRGVDLQKLIENHTGFRIANMTTFMKTIEKADENITKIGRGLYSYQE